MGIVKLTEIIELMLMLINTINIMSGIFPTGVEPLINISNHYMILRLVLVISDAENSLAIRAHPGAATAQPRRRNRPWPVALAVAPGRSCRPHCWTRGATLRSWGHGRLPCWRRRWVELVGDGWWLILWVILWLMMISDSEWMNSDYKMSEIMVK